MLHFFHNFAWKIMKMQYLFCLFFILCTLSLSTSEEKITNPPTSSFTTKVLKIENNASNSDHNNTQSIGRSIFPSLTVDGSMIQRALYVLIGITMIGLFYFLVRAVRLKKTTQRKKYGLLSNYDEDLEMAPLESDEEDTTVYEAKNLRR